MKMKDLPYQQMEFGRAKSAIFFPLYIDNVYIGYWILESGTPHDFDNVDTTVSRSNKRKYSISFKNSCTSKNSRINCKKRPIYRIIF